MHDNNKQLTSYNFIKWCFNCDVPGSERETT